MTSVISMALDEINWCPAFQGKQVVNVYVSVCLKKKQSCIIIKSVKFYSGIIATGEKRYCYRTGLIS